MDIGLEKRKDKKREVRVIQEVTEKDSDRRTGESERERQMKAERERERERGRERGVKDEYEGRDE